MTDKSDHSEASQAGDQAAVNSRLERIAEILDLDVSVFYKERPRETWLAEPDPDRMQRFVESDEGRRLLAFFAQIQDVALRRRLIELVLSVQEYCAPKH